MNVDTRTDLVGSTEVHSGRFGDVVVDAADLHLLLTVAVGIDFDDVHVVEPGRRQGPTTEVDVPTKAAGDDDVTSGIEVLTPPYVLLQRSAPSGSSLRRKMSLKPTAVLVCGPAPKSIVGEKNDPVT